MTNCGRRFLWLGAALFALSGCETREIAPHPATYVDTEPGADRGGLVIVFAPAETTYEENQAQGSTNPNLTLYHLFVDGNQLAFANVDGYGTSYPITFLEGNEAGGGYIGAGRHRFEIAEAGGGATIFAGDGDIPAGSVTRLYLFRELGVLQARFVSYPEIPPPGTVHVSVMNLIRGGQRIEVVSCAGATSCAPLSPPLALGERFDADFAAISTQAADPSVPDDRLADGASVGYRAVATPTVPSPPVQPFMRSFTLSGAIRESPANLVAAPVYMTADGLVLAFYI